MLRCFFYCKHALDILHVTRKNSLQGHITIFPSLRRRLIRCKARTRMREVTRNIQASFLLSPYVIP